MGREIKIGLALGAGSAKGLAHIGIIQVLEEAGIKPHIITGTSMGAVIGGFYASGLTPGEMREMATSITKDDVKKLLPHRPSLTHLVDNSRIKSLFQKVLGDRKIEDLPVKFGCVATDILSGKEIYFTQGPMVEALLASSAIPGFFPAVKVGGSYLVDGGVVDPIPVDLARKLGADFVIAVNVMSWKTKGAEPSAQEEEGNFVERLRRALSRLLLGEENGPPHVISTFLYAVDIMQEEIVRSKLKVCPPEMFIHVDTSDFSSNEYYRADEIISRGEEVGRKVISYLTYLIDTFGR